MTTLKTSTTVTDDENVVHMIGATYDVLSDPHNPRWTYACWGEWRMYDEWRRQVHGLPLTCLMCIDLQCTLNAERES